MAIPIVFERCQFPPSLQLLAEVERVAGRSLPSDLRRFLIEHHGGEPSRNSITADGSPVRRDGPYEVVSFHRLHPGNVFQPTGYESIVIEIAGASKAKNFCYVLGPKEVGSIVLCVGRYKEERHVVRTVSSTLEAFLDELVVDPIEGWDRYRGYSTLTSEERTYVDFEPFLPEHAILDCLRGPSLAVHRVFVDCYPAVTNEHFAWMEQGFHIRVPLDIRDFYQRFNGGRPSHPLRIPTKEGTLRFHHFFNMQYPVPLGDLGELTEHGMFEYRGYDLKWRDKFLPAHLFPIASADDVICFSSRKEDFGSIWRYVNHFYERGYKKLADSFNEFVNMLEEAPRP